MKKERLDTLLCQRGLASGRDRAKSLIMEGIVFVSGQRVDKPGTTVDPEADIEVRGAVCPFVSRGGLKLQKALTVFGADVAGLVCLDTGASTGGFTDCLLQSGAAKVFAVDVGYGQLAWTLRNDPRVVSMERTNIRYVTPEQLGEPLGFATLDVSFISLKLVLPVVRQLLGDGGRIICLVKPQFEAGKGKVGKKGVVREPEIHLEVLEDFVSAARELGFGVLGLSFSPVKGPEGNIEFLGYLQKDGQDGQLPELSELVAQAHETLRGN